MNSNPVTQNLVDKINSYSKAGLPMGDLESFLDSKLSSYNSVALMDKTAISEILNGVNISDAIHKLALTHTQENILQETMTMLEHVGIDPEQLLAMKDPKNITVLMQVLTDLVTNELHTKLEQLLQLPKSIGQSSTLEVLAKILDRLQ